jgi:hypothetical protein
MNSKSNSYEEENIARGCLKLNNKIYPVFEGLNTVGRSPEAIINLKHLVGNDAFKTDLTSNFRTSANNTPLLR